MPEAIAYYDPGADITCHASVALTGKRGVAITANRRAGGPAGLDDTSDGNIVVGLPAANGRIFGVASHDAALNAKVNIMRGPKAVPMEMGTGSALAAFAEVAVQADGRVGTYTLGAGVWAIGHTLTGGGAAGTDVQVQLYVGGYATA